MIGALGLDLSCTAAGVALPNGGTTRTIRARAGSHEPARRLHEIVEHLSVWIASKQIDVAVLEGYAPSAIGIMGKLRNAEVGGAIRIRLFELGIPYVEIAPNTLKLFATGNGKAKKDEMVAAAKAAGGTGADVANDNEADAWHLWHLAQTYYRNPYHERINDTIRRLPWPALQVTGGLV